MVSLRDAGHTISILLSVLALSSRFDGLDTFVSATESTVAFSTRSVESF